jgi:hypothetical protein
VPLEAEACKAEKVGGKKGQIKRAVCGYFLLKLKMVTFLFPEFLEFLC